jgi:hypothetical protein
MDFLRNDYNRAIVARGCVVLLPRLTQMDAVATEYR